MNHRSAPNNTLGRVVRGGLFMLCSFLLVAAAGLLIMRLNGLQLLSVQSASMAPTFRKGDALLVAPVQAADIGLGKIVTFGREGVIVSHRVIEVDGNNRRLVTKGDANQKPDTTIAYDMLTGQPLAIVPGLGAFIDAAHSKVAIIIGVYLPATLLFITELKRLAAAYTAHVYSAARPAAR